MGQVEVAGRYLLRGRLGVGVGTEVYEAFDQVIERRVAIKIANLPPLDYPENATSIDRFRQGAKAAGRLNHPHIVAVLDFGQNIEQAWIVMELIEGGSLKDLLKTVQPSLETTTQIMIEMLDALEYSHRNNIIHRDIKPENIMLTKNGSVKLTDFGIARIEDSSLTQVGSTLGTPAYMAPEQFRGEDVDSRADIWASGVVFYQLLTGEKPFNGSMTTIMHKVMHETPRAPSQVLPTTGMPAFDGIVAKAMKKAPEDRYGSASEFSAALLAAVGKQRTRLIFPTTSGKPLDESDDTMVASATTRDNLPRSYNSRPRFKHHASSHGAAPSSLASRPANKHGFVRVGGIGILALGLVLSGLMLIADKLPNSLRAASPLVDANLQPPLTSEPRIVVPSPIIAAQVHDTVTPALPLSREPDINTAATMVRTAPCSLLSAVVQDQVLLVTGVTRRSEVSTISRAIEALGLPSTAIHMSISSFTEQYCGVLDAVRPVAATGSDRPVTTLISADPLIEGQGLKFTVLTPNWPSRLYIAYLTESGEIGPLTAVDGPLHAPDTLVTFGDGERWKASAPFGTDLLITIASEIPLFNSRRRPERVETFLPVLQAALRDVQNGGRAAVRVITVGTVSKQ